MNGRGCLSGLSQETQEYNQGQAELADEPGRFIQRARTATVLSESQPPEEKESMGGNENDSCNSVNNRRHDFIISAQEEGQGQDMRGGRALSSEPAEPAAGSGGYSPCLPGTLGLILRFMGRFGFPDIFSSLHTLLAGCFLTVLVLIPVQIPAQTPPAVPAEARGFSGGGLHLYPLGWSSEGRWGALIGRDPSIGSPGIRVLIIDAVTDEVLHYSDSFPWSGPDSFAAFWARYAKQVLETAASFHLEAALKPDVRDARFTTGGYNYEFTMEPPSPASGPYTLRIQSSRGDVKDVYHSSASRPSGKALLLGALVSPFEERALAVIREDDSYRFSGAHLTLGFAYRQPSGKSTGRLISAVFNGQAYLVKARLSAGADPDEKDERGYTALLVAARLRLWGIAADLLSAGASPDSRDKEGRTALHYAAFSGEEEIVRKLLSAGADRGIRDRAGRIPADLAAEATVRALLQ